MKAAYKCRLCGEIITQGCTGRENAMEIIVYTVLKDDNSLNENLINKSIAGHCGHTCEDGSFGYCDFIGFKMEEE